MPPHTHSQPVLYLSHTEDLVLDLCPADYCMLISCMLHPWRENGAEGDDKVDPMPRPPRTASRTQFRSATSTSHPSFALRASISLGAQLQFFFFLFFLRWLSSEHWFLLPNCSVTASPHLIIHKMHKFETKMELFLYLRVICVRPWEENHFMSYLAQIKTPKVNGFWRGNFTFIITGLSCDLDPD